MQPRAQWVKHEVRRNAWIKKTFLPKENPVLSRFFQGFKISNTSHEDAYLPLFTVQS